MKYLIYHNYGPEPMLSRHHEDKSGVSRHEALRFIEGHERDDARAITGYWLVPVRPAAPTYSVTVSDLPSDPSYRDTRVVACMPGSWRIGGAAGLSWAEAVQVFHRKQVINARYGSDLHYEVVQDA